MMLEFIMKRHLCTPPTHIYLQGTWVSPSLLCCHFFQGI